LSEALLLKIQKECSNLNSLTLKYADLNSFKIECIPLTIEKLCLIRCEIPVRWFNSSTRHLLNNLKYLDLSESSSVRSSHLEDIGAHCGSQLEILNLKHCYRIDNASIELIQKNFTSIKSLNLEGTAIHYYSLHLVYHSNSFQNLEYLNVKNCPNFKSNILDFWKKSKRNLRPNLEIVY
jgi:hypothetical protein